jgi:hypothetical protein
VIIRMQKRLQSEKIAEFRSRTTIPEGAAIGEQLEAWARSVFDDAVTARPEMPEGVKDRQADVWEPLLVVADLAGGEWPKLAREAAVAFVKADSQTPPSTKLRLLRDLRLVFWENLRTVAETRPKGLITETLMGALCNLDDSPWQTNNKGANGAREAFTTIELAKHMFDYGVEPEQLRPYPGDNYTQKRGYPLAPLADVWRRYLPPLYLPSEAVTGVTSVTRAVLDEYFKWVLVDDDGKPVTGVTDVTGAEGPTQRDSEEAEVKAEVPEPAQASEPEAPNFAEVLGRPVDWSPFDVKPKNRG